MWKLVTYVACVVILFPNAYGYVDYTSYLLSRLTEYINQVNQLLKMIYKQRSNQAQIGGDPFGIGGLENNYLYDALWQTITALKNSYRVMSKLEADRMTSHAPDIIALKDHVAPPDLNIEHMMGFKQSGRRGTQGPLWTNNFYEALASAFKKFLLSNPDVRTQLGEDFNADALINPPEPEKNK